MPTFQEIQPEQFDQSPFRRIGKDWMLIASEANGKMNAMTASWGGMGVMWGKNVAYIVIRPQRFTKTLVDAADTLSLTFFNNDQKKMLTYMGTASGHNEDKIAKSQLTVVRDQSAPYFEEANTVMICKKLFAQPYTPDSFIDPKIREEWYPDNDYHTLYVAEITKLLVKA